MPWCISCTERWAFFLSYLANDMEEDNEAPKQAIFAFLYGKNYTQHPFFDNCTGSSCAAWAGRPGSPWRRVRRWVRLGRLEQGPGAGLQGPGLGSGGSEKGQGGASERVIVFPDPSL